MARDAEEEQLLSVSPPPPDPDGKNGTPKRGSSPSKQQQEEVAEELCDEGMQQVEKKRRLTSEQVKFLEHSFEVENKLEPERKLQIAKKLGLQPRQIAVWFQNRRARWKTKQLERDFEALKSSYDVALKENEKLQAQVASLNALLNNKKCCVEGRDVGGTAAAQDQTIPLLSVVNVSNTPDQSAGKVEEELLLSSKSEVESPTKSDQSEVLDSGYCLPASDIFRLFDPDGLLESMCSPVFLQSVAVKIEESVFQEESFSFPFSMLDEPFLFPCHS